MGTMWGKDECGMMNAELYGDGPVLKKEMLFVCMQGMLNYKELSDLQAGFWVVTGGEWLVVSWGYDKMSVGGRVRGGCANLVRCKINDLAIHVWHLPDECSR